MNSLLKTALILTAFFGTFNASSQAITQMTYLDQMFEHTEDSSAVYLRTMELIQDDIFAASVKAVSGGLKMKGVYVSNGQELIEDGLFTYYFPNGNVESEGRFDMGLKSGTWKRFTKDGNRKADRFYNPAAHSTIRNAMNGQGG